MNKTNGSGDISRERITEEIWRVEAERERDDREVLLQGSASIHCNGWHRVLQRWCEHSIQSCNSEGIELLCLHRLFISHLCSLSPFASALRLSLVLFYLFIIQINSSMQFDTILHLVSAFFFFRSRGLPQLNRSLIFRIFLLGVIG